MISLNVKESLSFYFKTRSFKYIVGNRYTQRETYTFYPIMKNNEKIIHSVNVIINPNDFEYDKMYIPKIIVSSRVVLYVLYFLNITCKIMNRIYSY